MKEHEKYRIEKIAADGAPELPAAVYQKYVKQCGVLVRDHIPIIVREWIKPKEGGVLYVGEKAKEKLFEKMMDNFTLPAPEVTQDDLDENPDEDPELILARKEKAMLELVKGFTSRKMAQQFNNWKKRLNLDFIQKDKTPDFTGTYEKVKPYWEEFVQYKKSEEALERSARNKKNTAKKMYHHTMGQAGYKGSLPKWDKLEDDLIAKDIIPETVYWDQRTRSWFFGHGGTLDSEGKCIYNVRHEEDPLPIDALRDAIRAVKEGKFIPDRENDELSRALGNKEHYGRTRTAPGSVPWKHGFPEEKKKYPDRSRQRRKDLLAAEAQRQVDRWTSIEEELKRQREQAQRQQVQIDRLSQQQGTGQSLPQMEAAFDGTAPSNRKSSVASTQLLSDDGYDAPPMMYPVDHITEMTPCELHVKLLNNITIKAAVGYVKPAGPEPTHHGRPVPPGYALVGVDEVMTGFEPVKLDYPEGEDGEVTELGDAKNLTILWLKEHILFPNWTPRPTTAQGSHPPSPPPAPQDQSPPPQDQSPQRSSSYSPPRSPSPARASPSPRQPSPPKKSDQGSSKRRRTASPKRQRSPLPKVPHANLTKLPYHYTPEETQQIAKGQYEAWKSREKAPKEPDFPDTEEDKARALKMVKTLYQPEPRLTPDYERFIQKAHDEKERSKKSTSGSGKCGKSVDQLGQQKNQSIPPLKVHSNTEVGQSTYAGEEIDPEFVAMYGEAAAAAGMSIAQYLANIPTGDIEHQYRYGHPLVRPGEENDLPTKMRRVHNWYMEASAKSEEWIMMPIRNEHHGYGERTNMIEFQKLNQLFQQRALDKSILSAYCL